MEKEVGILYYDFMMESVVENRRIMENITASNCMRIIVKEDASEVAVYEASLLESLVKFIKTIIDNLIKFIKKIFNVTTKTETFTPKKAIIKAFENKMKTISNEQKDSFLIKDIDITQEVIGRIEDINLMIKSVKSDLDSVMVDFGNIISRVTTNDVALDNIQNDIMEYDKRLASKTDLEDIKRDSKDVDIEAVKIIFNDYKVSKETINAFNISNKQTQTTLETYKKKVEKASKGNIIENMLFDYIPKYKDTVNLGVTFIAKAIKCNLDLLIYNFKNQEAILSQFISF